jgi:hypothetical protein
MANEIETNGETSVHSEVDRVRSQKNGGAPLEGASSHSQDDLGLPSLLSQDQVTGHSVLRLLRDIRSVEPKSRRTMLLRQVHCSARRSSDDFLRDMVLANWPEQRSDEEILREPWWPNIARILCSSLEVHNKRSVLRELDNYFRWKQRQGELGKCNMVDTLFLDAEISTKQRYRRLCRLTHALDIILPGEPALRHLRVVQRTLYAKTHPPENTLQRQAERIPEVEWLLSQARHHKTGKPYADATKTRHRAALNLLYKLISDAELPFRLDRRALDIFADHTFQKRDAWAALHERNEPANTNGKGWCRMSAWTKCAALTPYIADQALREEWQRFAQHFHSEAQRKGDLKAKERALSRNPVTLNDLFRKAASMVSDLAEETDVQRRHSMAIVVGALGVLLFYPLRGGDLRRLRFGHELVRDNGAWSLAIETIQKTGEYSAPLKLPSAATTLIDACLLHGAPRVNIADTYRSCAGQYLLQSPRANCSFRATAFTRVFSKHVGHPPHTVRTIWCDELVARGADRLKISAMLQHKNLLSQKEYEVLASKFRRDRAVEALRSIAEEQR